jgi:beta-glucosidase
MNALALILALQAPVLQQDGLRFKDLNRNGALDAYEDSRLSPERRARDLVGRMTLEEKAGAMMHGTARSGGPMGAVGMGAGYDTAAIRVLIDSAKVNSMITRLGGGSDPAALAAQNNALQAIAERTRLGIPVTISTDPRHHFQYVPGTSSQTSAFSQWPEPLGFAAIGDTALMRRFGDIARQEYRAVGIHMALSPQADLATEPRWGRITGTFGEDAALAERLVRAYVIGFQHGSTGLDTGSVVTVVKHWVGYGAAKDGFDSHSYYGRFASFPGRNLEYHIRPFLGAFAAHAGGVMPTYSILEDARWDGRPIEPVGAGFNRQLLTDMLRRRYGFQGVVVTDWAITWDCAERCRMGAPAGQRPTFADLGMPWGVEHLSMRARFVKAVQAGVDQFGGTERADLLVEAVRAGELTEARLDSSVVRILTQKFALGLFENPYVNAESASFVVGNHEFKGEALGAQMRALVLLENKGQLLPLRSPPNRPLRVYLHGIAPEAASQEGWTVTTDSTQADVAIMRLSAPFERLHPQYMFGTFLHEGSLAFKDGDPEYESFKRVSAVVPTIVTVYLDRPAILTPIRDAARAVIVNFGVSDTALLFVLTGRARPQGKLPFELPSSMEAVEAQRSDVPHDSRRPLYPFGFGRTYAQTTATEQRDWVQLFNGRNLDGWDVKITGRDLNDNWANTFRVEDGLLKVRYDGYDAFADRFGHIFYREPYSYYIVAVEYRFVGQQARGGADWALRNSGVMIHSQSARSMAKDQDFPISIEVQLLGGSGTGDRPTANLCTPGTHVVMDGKLFTQHCVNSRSQTYHGEQWVRVEVQVFGDSLIRHIVNGDTVLEYSKPQIGGGVVNHFDPAIKQDGNPLTAGYIALQSESHPIDFRKVEILNLVGCMDRNASNYRSYYVRSDPAKCL